MNFTPLDFKGAVLNFCHFSDKFHKKIIRDPAGVISCRTERGVAACPCPLVSSCFHPLVTKMDQ